MAAPGVLDARESAGLLRFITCGSVDDGKSTLIGRMLYDSQALLDDQLAALASDSKRFGTRGGELDFALLMDGLQAEREQGITIDVSYRYFSTARRNFIIADTPGHEQYTRNMVTGASTADAAVILVDARKGVLTQTRRHAYIVGLLGIRHVLVAVNKMDLAGYDEVVFRGIERDFGQFAARAGVAGARCFPLCATTGENVARRSAVMPWYDGPALLEHLESLPVDDHASGPLRLVVQWANRPSQDFRGASGRVVGGALAVGDAVRVLPSGTASKVARIVAFEGDRPSATSGESVTVVLADDVDAGRGDMIVAASSPAQVADQFEATVVWMARDEMLPGRPYLVKMGARTVGASLSRPKHKLHPDTLERLAARTLHLNDIGVCNLHLDATVPFDPYAENRDTGGFIVIDRMGGATVGAGMLHFALRRAHNIHWQAVEVGKQAHAALKGHRPAIVWFTGLSGAGKSTIANIVERKLHAEGVHSYLLDGDNVRHGLNRDLGFSEADRVENVRRVAEVARLMVDAGLVVLVSLISPFRAERRLARGLVGEGEFVEVFVDTPLAVAEARDPKGLYRKARRGELANFTGIDSPYEAPEHPEVRLGPEHSAEEAADRVLERLAAFGIIRAR